LLDTNTEFLIKSKESSDGELTIQAHSRPPSDYFMKTGKEEGIISKIT
jgi:hypothetical protein